MSMETGHRDWPNITDQKLNSRYEKCRNITEEIYKRINITFQIKKLEAGQSELSDNSEAIDSNETDLFACDKSDITSSTEAEKPPTDCGKFININNNEEKNKPVPVYRRPKKRFRKRVKKRPVRACSNSEGSSDEEPLSRMAEPDAAAPHAAVSKLEKRLSKKDTTKKPPSLKTPQKKPSEAIDKKNIEFAGKTLSVRIDKLPIPNVASYEDFPVKNYRSFMKDNKLTIRSETPSIRNDINTNVTTKDGVPNMDDVRALKADRLSMKTDKLSMKADKLSMKDEKEKAQWKNCSLCSLSFRGERGLRRHMSMSHVIPEDCK